MYGPPIPPPRRDVRAEILRWVLALVPLVSLGLLAWVPFLNVAAQRKRRSDWWFVALYVTLSVIETIMFANIPSDAETDLSAFAGGYVIALMAGACCHAAITGYLPRRGHAAHHPGPAGPYTPYGHPPPVVPGAYAAPPPPHVPPPHTPQPHASAPPPASPRMRQVASELDELDAYLRREEGR
ncbi:hypothetical protein [Streptomyces avicenniae]|uniref:hypothetical protein n=1 Tax=Streptomyces avicenniae TaxID=500153 RepID=UPI0006995BB1|nr:hypothetical protein [Streptomyces avicenniae]